MTVLEYRLQRELHDARIGPLLSWPLERNARERVIHACDDLQNEKTNPICGGSRE